MEKPEDWLFLQLVLEESVYLIPEGQLAVNNAAQIQTHQLSVLGEMKAGVLIGVGNANFRHSQAYDFLMKILLAVKLTPDDVGIMALGDAVGSGFSLEQLRQGRAFHKVMLFGVEANTLGLPALPLYETVSQGVLVTLAADGLEVIMHDVQKKKALWVAMQQLFSDRL